MTWRPPPLPPTPPSVLARAAHRRLLLPLRDAWGSGPVVLLLVVALWWGLPLLAVPACAVAAVVAGRRTWQRWHGVPVGPGWLTWRWAATLTYLCAWLPLLAGYGPPLSHLVALAGLGLCEWLLRTPPPGPVTVAWWAHARLQHALVAAGVLKADPPPTLRYRGRPVTDEHGTTVTLALPAGSTWEDVQKRRTQLASALDVPERRLAVTHDPAAPANAVTLWVGLEHTRGVTVSPLADTALTCWRDPLRIGVDARGGQVQLLTDEQNTLVGGKPGMGKTSMVRLLLAHYLLDPSTVLYGLDGKGSRKDYAAVAPLCARWVWGTDDDPAADTLALLHEVLGVVRYRNQHSRDEPAGGWPGVLVLLEELQDVRAGASDAQRDELDVLLGRIIRMGRAVAVHLVFSTQRPSVEDIPSGVRNLVTQNLALVLRNGADTALVLGLAPGLALPARRGEALLATPAGVDPVELDLLDLPAFEAVCARAARARAHVPHLPLPVEPGVSLVKGAGSPDPCPLADPLTEAVHSLLEVGATKASVLMELLPEQLRPANATALGKALAAMPGLQRTRVGKDAAWQLDPSRTSRAPLAGEACETPAGLSRARIAAAGGDLSHVPQPSGEMP